MYPDLDEIWPPSSALVGMQFATAEDLERCQALLREHLDCYREVYKKTLLVVVRKTDAHLFAEAGLTYTEREVVDGDQMLRSPEERERLRQWMRAVNTRMLHGLSLEQ